MSGIKEVVPTLVVNLQIGHMKGEDLLRVLLEVLEDVGECPGDYPSVGVPLCSSGDGEGLPRACLWRSKCLHLYKTCGCCMMHVDTI